MFPENALKVRLEVAVTGKKLVGVPAQFDTSRLRVFARYCLFAEYSGGEPLKCVVDTGAERTILPRKVWQQFDRPNGIHWLNQKTTVTGIGGASIPANLGLVYLHIFDALASDWSKASKIQLELVAACADDGINGARELPFGILGIGGGVTARCGFCLNFSRNSVDDSHETYLVKI